jgi:hypothetical protein
MVTLEIVEIEGKFRAPIRNTYKLAKPISQNCDHLGQKEDVFGTPDGLYFSVIHKWELGKIRCVHV